MDGKPQSLLAQNARLVLNAALASDYGIEVEVVPIGDIPSPTLRAKQVLYRFKRENTDFACLRIFQAPDDDSALWITKQSIGDSDDSDEE